MPGRRRQPDFDPYEFGARRSDPLLAALEPLPSAPPRIRTSTILLCLAVGIAVVVFSRGTTGNDNAGPAVKGSCTQAAAALDKTETRAYRSLAWSATGPPTSSVVIGLDTTSLPTSDTAGRLLGPVPLTGCRAHGRVGVRATAGSHVLAGALRHHARVVHDDVEPPPAPGGGGDELGGHARLGQVTDETERLEAGVRDLGGTLGRAVGGCGQQDVSTLSDQRLRRRVADSLRTAGSGDDRDPPAETHGGDATWCGGSEPTTPHEVDHEHEDDTAGDRELPGIERSERNGDRESPTAL